MDDMSIEAVFSKAVAETYRQFLEAYDLLDAAEASKAGALEDKGPEGLDTGLAA